MSEILIKWLNEEIHLSQKIINISADFKTGYLFAELLYKTKQLQNLSEYKNTSKNKDIIHNFCLLDQVLLRIGINLTEEDRDQMMKENIYTAEIYLLKIKQYLDKKFINLEQLNHKYSNDLQKLYNNFIFKNKNQKYLYNLKIRIENEKNNMNKAIKLRSLTEKNQKYNTDNKYDIGGYVYFQLKKKYSHLNLTDFELDILLTEMKETEKRYQSIKESIQKIETSRKDKCYKKEDQEINLWKSSIININNYKKESLTQLWKPVLKKQAKFKLYMKKQITETNIRTENFDKNLGVFLTEKIKEQKDDEENTVEEKENIIDLQKSLQMKNEVYISQIKEKLEQKMKSKRDKEKRERKRLKEEREMFERMNNEKNMKEMIAKMENNLNRRKKQKEKEDEENVDDTQQLMKYLSPEEKQRIRDVDELINKELNNQNKIDQENNEKEKHKNHIIDMNITKILIKREKDNENIVKENKEINEEENKQEENNKEENKEENFKGVEKENVSMDKSSYSKLSNNDYGLNLMNEAFEIHKVNKYNINNRIKLFKTRLLFTEDSEQKYNNLPNIFNFDEEKEKDNNKKKESKIKEEIKTQKDSDILDKDLFYEEMDKLNYDNFIKESNKRKIKKQKRINVIKPLLNQILDITDYIYDYQQKNNIEIIDNEKWDELMNRFKNGENIKDKEEEILEEKNELSEYLFDYGYKLDFNDSLIIFDYANYLSVFNDLIIPDNERGKIFKFYELYEDFYEPNQDINIKEYEPKEEELENLTLPKYPDFINYNFFEIIENSFKSKYNKQERNSITQNKSEIFTKKGKYFYIPIKMSFTGYPLSGKKVQSNLIVSKYPKIKIFDPEEIFQNKLDEYNQLKEPVEKSTKNKNLKPNQLEQLNKEREEKLEQFKPVLDIIKPYLDYIDEYNSGGINLNLHETNFKEDILTDIYINLLIYEIDLAFPNDIESKIKFIEEIKGIYNEYLNIKEQINEIKKKEEENMKETDDKNNKNKKQAQNFSKDLETLNKKLESIISDLYIGFIVINFPKNEKQSKKLENKITGFISVFEKPKDELTEKIFSFENLLDINIKNNTKNLLQISMFDFFFNLNISSEEVDRRFQVAKYDPGTKKIYNMELNPPNDKKILEKLLPGIPGFDDKKLKEEKINYEKNKSGVSDFYKMMSNGMEKIYKNIDQMDKSYNNNINNIIEESMEKLIFENYYKNLDLIINIINQSKTLEKSIEKNDENNNNVEQENNVKEEFPNKEEKKEEEKTEQNNQFTTEETKMTNEKNMITENILPKETELSMNINMYNISDDISNQFEIFASDYQNLLTNFFHFLSRQKFHIELYLTKIQEDFIIHLNRKTDKENIAHIYNKKYNSIINTQPNLLKNQKVIDELSNDIEDVAKSIWLNIQNKKNEDIKYLNDLKENNTLNGELEKFWDFALKIFEIEVKKYLITCEIIIKYYLNQIGYLPEILDNMKNNNSDKEKSDDFIFKVDYLKYFFQGIDNSKIINKINFLEEEEEKKETIIKEKKDDEENDNKKDKTKEDKKIEKMKSIEENNEQNKTKSNLNQTNKFSHSTKSKNEKIIEDNVQILFLNSLKIIIRQDLLMKQYKERIKTYNPQENPKPKNSTNKLNTSIISSSSTKKSRMNKLSKPALDEEFSQQIKIEKDKFKYRLMFLKNYIIKYFQIIIECFNTTYNTMDDWIIMSVRNQNNSLNEFVNHLKKILNKNSKSIDLDKFEFDNFNIYSRHKVDIVSILDNMNLTSFIDTNKQIKNKDEKKEIILININDISYSDKFVYNINDLMQIYNYLKSFGNDGCDYLIKYEIVKEILVHKFFAKRKYENKISNNPINTTNEDDIEKKTLFKSQNKINFEENNGIPKAIKFLSNVNYINCLDNFSEYQNNYININDLFTCLILIGSELITSEKFEENIKEKNNKEIISSLSKEEFLDLNLWFDEDKYLNSFSDIKEETFFSDKNNENKIKKIKSCIFEINEEEGKISLNKIINLLNKFSRNKNDVKLNEEDEQSDINRDIKNEENPEEQNKEEKEEKEDKEEKEEKEDNIEKENNEEKEEKENVEIKVDNEEKENIQVNEEIENKTKSNKDFKESIKNDEMTSRRNESEFLTSSNKKYEKRDELKNNFFNSIFYNQQL